MEASWLCFILVLFQNLSIIIGDIQCLDRKGKPVDWFIIYKLPRLNDDPNPLIQEGLGHFYLDVNGPKFELSDISLNKTNHALWHTLQQIYDNPKSEDVFYAMYNDEFPDGKKSMSRGHTKGDLAFDKNTGFWLVHSLPKFPPPATEGYAYPHSGTYYGQTFLCVSYKTTHLEKIATQLLYNYPGIYDYNLPDAFKKLSSSLLDAMEGHHIKSAPWSNTVNLTSIGGKQFVSFAKFTDFDADLYDSLVAPFLQSALLTETWQNGKGKTPSNCTSKFVVLNIRDLKISDDSTSVVFKETQDHSKWAMTTDIDTGTEQTWICIGDINRADSQRQRAGGTVCTESQAVWMQFAQSVTQVEECPTKYHKLQSKFHQIKYKSGYKKQGKPFSDKILLK